MLSLAIIQPVLAFWPPYLASVKHCSVACVVTKQVLSAIAQPSILQSIVQYFTTSMDYQAGTICSSLVQ